MYLKTELRSVWPQSQQTSPLPGCPSTPSATKHSAEHQLDGSLEEASARGDGHRSVQNRTRKDDRLVSESHVHVGSAAQVRRQVRWETGTELWRMVAAPPQPRALTAKEVSGFIIRSKE